jgi:ribosome-binding factor A
MTLRQDKIQNLLIELASRFFSKESNRASLLTITSAEVSRDLKNATIFITVYPENKEKEALNFAKRQRTHLRDYIKSELRVKITPFLEIEIDLGEKNRQRVEELSTKM